MSKASQMTGTIYGIRCKANERIYIGSSVQVQRRFYLHRLSLKAGNHHSPRLQASWNKYGPDAFEFEVLETVDDVLFLTAREQFWIWRNEDILLNCSLAAGSPLGVKRTDDQKLRMKQAKTSFYATDAGKEHLALMHSKNRGRVQSPEERTMRSKALKGKAGRIWTDETRAQHSKDLTGRKMPPVSDETKRRISEANTGKTRSREAIAASAAGRKAFIDREIDQWMEMSRAGLSFRKIEIATGRCRLVIAREVKARMV